MRLPSLSRGFGIGCGLAIALFLALGACGAFLAAVEGTDSGIHTTDGAGPSPVATKKANKKADKKVGTSFGTGMYLVGTDVKAGQYKTANSDGECYWERLKDDSGNFGAIKANEFLEGPGRVTIREGEYFNTNGCVWDLVR